MGMPSNPSFLPETLNLARRNMPQTRKKPGKTPARYPWPPNEKNAAKAGATPKDITSIANQDWRQEHQIRNTLLLPHQRHRLSRQ